MHVNFRLTIGILLSTLAFSFFVIQVQSEETSDIATSTATTSPEIAEIGDIQDIEPQLQAIEATSSPATSTYFYDNNV